MQATGVRRTPLRHGYRTVRDIKAVGDAVSVTEAETKESPWRILDGLPASSGCGMYEDRHRNLEDPDSVFGVRSNCKETKIVCEYAAKAWRFWLSRYIVTKAE